MGCADPGKEGSVETVGYFVEVDGDLVVAVSVEVDVVGVAGGGAGRGRPGGDGGDPLAGLGGDAAEVLGEGVDGDLGGGAAAHGVDFDALWGVRGEGELEVGNLRLRIGCCRLRRRRRCICHPWRRCSSAQEVYPMSIGSWCRPSRGLS